MEKEIFEEKKRWHNRKGTMKSDPNQRHARDFLPYTLEGRQKIPNLVPSTQLLQLIIFFY